MTQSTTVRDRTIQILAASLERNTSSINDDSLLDDLSLEALAGTGEEQNLPSSTDGLRPSELVFVRLCFDLAEEFDVLFVGEDLDRLETVRDYYLLIESLLAES